MELCKLCEVNNANKKNTHYLTDAIIRTCLNIEGSNNREKGLYFAINSSNPFIEFNFQRLDELTLENTIGRKPTEEEIEKAKSIPFSVDYIFCSECESKFTVIETEFIEKVLPKFRNNDLSGVNYLNIEEKLICRNFFYIQIYRSAICEDKFILPNDLVENLKSIIINKLEDYSIPLSITYLKTTGGQAVYTENFVGFTNDKNPYLIFMNDFIIQFYDSFDSIKFLDFYGLNQEDNYKEYINYEEDEFIFKILSNEERKEFLKNLIQNEKVKQTLEYFGITFDQIWNGLFGVNAPSYQRKKYVISLVNHNPKNLLNYSRDEVYKFTFDYLVKLLNIQN